MFVYIGFNIIQLTYFTSIHALFYFKQIIDLFTSNILLYAYCVVLALFMAISVLFFINNAHIANTKLNNCKQPLTSCLPLESSLSLAVPLCYVSNYSFKEKIKVSLGLEIDFTLLIGLVCAFMALIIIIVLLDHFITDKFKPKWKQKIIDKPQKVYRLRPKPDMPIDLRANYQNIENLNGDLKGRLIVYDHFDPLALRLTTRFSQTTRWAFTNIGTRAAYQHKVALQPHTFSRGAGLNGAEHVLRAFSQGFEQPVTLTSIVANENHERVIQCDPLTGLYWYGSWVVSPSADLSNMLSHREPLITQQIGWRTKVFVKEALV